MAFASSAGFSDDNIEERLARVEAVVLGCKGQSIKRIQHTNNHVGHIMWTCPNEAKHCGLSHFSKGGNKSSFNVHINLDYNSWPDPFLHPFPWLRSVYDLKKGLEFRIDPLGFARVYYISSGDGFVWSNRMSALAAFLNTVPLSSQKGWASYATVGWFLEDLLPFEEMKILRGGEIIKVSPTGQTFNRSGVSLEDLLSVTNIPHDEDVLKNMCRHFEYVLGKTKEKIIFGLSGGRDSRLLAAVALSTKYTNKFSTITSIPPNLEGDIAKRLVSSANCQMVWSIQDRSVSDWQSKQYDLEQFLLSTVRTARAQQLSWNAILTAIHSSSAFGEKVRDWHAIFDADIYPTFIYRNPPENPLVPFNDFSVTGAGGEFAHANFYTMNHIHEPIANRLAKFRKNFFELTPFTTNDARFFTASLFDNIVKDSQNAGINGYNIFDYFYVRGRFKRWAGGNWSVNQVLPLANPLFLLAGFWQKTEEKLDTQLHRRLTSRLMPEWSQIPYFHELSANLDIREKTNVGARCYLWDTSEYSSFLRLLRNKSHYSDCFDVDSLVKCFKNIKEQPYSNMVRLQNIAMRVAWREGFERYRLDLKKKINDFNQK